MKITVELSTARPSKDGICRVQLVLVNKGRARYYFGIGSTLKGWDKARRRLARNAPHAVIKNDRIEQEIRRAEELALKEPDLTPQALVARLKAPDASRPVRLVDAIKEERDRTAHKIASGTLASRGTVINDVQAAIPLATLHGLGVEDLYALDKFYLAKGLSANTRRVRLATLRAMYAGACRHHKIKPSDVFLGVAPSEIRTIKTFLSKEHVDLLASTVFEKPGMQLAVDSWLLQYYLGALRFNEVVRLRWDMYREGAFRWIEGKVPKPRLHPVSEKAQRIIDKYRGGKNVLPLIPDGLTGDEWTEAKNRSNKSVNEWLGKACKMLGIPRITTHNARHTGAQRIKTNTKDVHLASRILGHATIAQTEAYFNELDETGIAEAVDGL